MNQRRTSFEIDCPTCRGITLVRPDPIHEGLRKVGEAWVCTGCGTRYPTAAATPFRQTDASRPQIFGANDREEQPQVFGDDERRHSCAWCQHLVLNPFEQRCGLTNHEVEATDLCDDFALRQEELPKPQAAKPDPLAAIFGS